MEMIKNGTHLSTLKRIEPPRPPSPPPMVSRKIKLFKFYRLNIFFLARTKIGATTEPAIVDSTSNDAHKSAACVFGSFHRRYVLSAVYVGVEFATVSSSEAAVFADDANEWILVRSSHGTTGRSNATIFKQSALRNGQQ